MPPITVRNLTPEVHRALKARAAVNGRSAEAEVRAILDEALFPPDRVRLGSHLQSIFAEVGGRDLDITRDKTPYEPPDFT